MLDYRQGNQGQQCKEGKAASGITFVAGSCPTCATAHITTISRAMNPSTRHAQHTVRTTACPAWNCERVKAHKALSHIECICQVYGNLPCQTMGYSSVHLAASLRPPSSSRSRCKSHNNQGNSAHTSSELGQSRQYTHLGHVLIKPLQELTMICKFSFGQLLDCIASTLVTRSAQVLMPHLAPRVGRLAS